MKTEAQFNLLTRAYRSEIRWRALLFSPFIIVAIVLCCELGDLVEHLLGDDYRVSIIGHSVIYGTVFGLIAYYKKSKDSLAAKLDLICPSCSHALCPDDHRMSATTNKCPYCRSIFFS